MLYGYPMDIVLHILWMKLCLADIWISVASLIIDFSFVYILNIHEEHSMNVEYQLYFISN